MNKNDMAAELNRIAAEKQRLPAGTSLREAIAQHLALYLPGAAGPTASDIGQIICAGVVTVERELAAMEEDGQVFHGTITVLPGETTRWWLAQRENTE
jgi:hypothetical protein